jgi:hypothetical protein
MSNRGAGGASRIVLARIVGHANRQNIAFVEHGTESHRVIDRHMIGAAEMLDDLGKPRNLACVCSRGLRRDGGRQASGWPLDGPAVRILAQM